jgi:hypothetical protein
VPFSDAAKSLLTSKTFYSGLLAIITGATTIVAGKDIDIPSRVGLTADQITTLGVTLGPLLYTLGGTAVASGFGAIYGRIMAHRPISFPGVNLPLTPAARNVGSDPEKLAALRERSAVPVRSIGDEPGDAARQLIDPDKEKKADGIMERAGLAGGPLIPSDGWGDAAKIEPRTKGPRVSPFSGNFSVSIVIVAASTLAVAGCTIPAALSPQSVSDLAAACSAFDDALDAATAAAATGKLAGPALMRAGALKQEANTKCQVPASMTPADVATVRADTQKLLALLPPAP